MVIFQKKNAFFLFKYLKKSLSDYKHKTSILHLLNICFSKGTNGDSGELKLRENDDKSRKFEKGQTDVFTFNDKINIGNIHKLRIWHDGKGFGAGLLCFLLNILCFLSLNRSFLFL